MLSVIVRDMHVHQVSFWNKNFCLHASSNKLELSGMLSIKTLFSAAGWSMTTFVVFRRFSSGSPSKLSLLTIKTQNSCLIHISKWKLKRKSRMNVSGYYKMVVPFFIGVQISRSLLCHQLGHSLSLVLLTIAHAGSEFWVYKLCCLHGLWKRDIYYPLLKSKKALCSIL